MCWSLFTIYWLNRCFSEVTQSHVIKVHSVKIKSISFNLIHELSIILVIFGNNASKKQAFTMITNQIFHYMVYLQLFWTDLKIYVHHKARTDQGIWGKMYYVQVQCPSNSCLHIWLEQFGGTAQYGQRVRSAPGKDGWNWISANSVCTWRLGEWAGGIREPKCNQNRINCYSIILWPITNRKNRMMLVYMGADKEKKVRTITIIYLLVYFYFALILMTIVTWTHKSKFVS